jgi:TolB-like protein
MKKDRDEINGGAASPDQADQISRYLADNADLDPADAAATTTTPPDSDDFPDAATLAAFARCDAVLALTARLADSPALAWAFAEAKLIAASEPPIGAAALPWFQRAAIAWSAAAVSAAAALFFAVLALVPAGENARPQVPAAASARIEFTPIAVSTELAARIADMQPVVLVAESVAVDSRSIVVLPFAGMASSPSAKMGAIEATADTIYAQVVRQLAAIPGIYVIDPRTAAVYADIELQPEQIALYLGVRGVLQGRVDSDGDTISLDLRFTDAAGAGHSIDRDFERPVAELALLQNDVALSVIDALIEPSATEPILN